MKFCVMAYKDGLFIAPKSAEGETEEKAKTLVVRVLKRANITYDELKVEQVVK